MNFRNGRRNLLSTTVDWLAADDVGGSEIGTIFRSNIEPLERRSAIFFRNIVDEIDDTIFN